MNGRLKAVALILALAMGCTGGPDDPTAATVAFPEGAEAAEWSLDPAQPLPGPDSRQVAALVHERACSSGRPPVGRVLPPIVVYGLDAVVVTFATRPLPGGQDCQGSPPAPVTFELTEPLGGRALLDGSVVPPADARIHPHERP
jgi:hypothetical protein